MFIGDDQIFIIFQYIAEPLALRACAKWMVKGKEDRRRFWDRDTALVAYIFRRKKERPQTHLPAFITADEDHRHKLVALTPGIFDRIGQPRFVPYDKSVED